MSFGDSFGGFSSCNSGGFSSHGGGFSSSHGGGSGGSGFCDHNFGFTGSNSTFAALWNTTSYTHAPSHSDTGFISSQGSPKSKILPICIISSIFLMCLVIFAVIVGTVLGVVLSSRAPPAMTTPTNTPMDMQSTLSFTPGETRIITYDSSFVGCDNLTLVTPFTSINITLSLIEGPVPMVSSSQRFSISRINEVEPNLWVFHLIKGSNVSIRMCASFRTSQSQYVTFNLVQGKDNFSAGSDSWNGPKISFTDFSNCDTINFQVRVEEDYYFVLSTSRFVAFDLIDFSLNMEFSRVQYSTAGVGSVPNCVVKSHGNCSVAVPVGSTGKALITTGLAEPVDWEERYQVSLVCGNRSWAVAVTVLIAILFLTLVIVMATVCVCVCCNVKLRGKKTITAKAPMQMGTAPRPPTDNESNYPPFTEVVAESPPSTKQEVAVVDNKPPEEFTNNSPPSYEDVIKSANAHH